MRMATHLHRPAFVSCRCDHARGRWPHLHPNVATAPRDAFDAENRLISVVVSGQTTSFVYDGDGNLVKKIKPDGSKTLYVGGIYIIPFGDEVDKTSGG